MGSVAVTEEPDLFGNLPEQERKFAEFDAANPAVWRLFVRFTFELIGRGFEHHGARDVLHRIRWETAVAEDTYGEGDGVTKGHKINNIWSPWYARKFHRTYPQFDGFFRLRKAKADDDMQQEKTP